MLALKGATEQSREGEVNEGKELMSNCKEGIKQKDTMGSYCWKRNQGQRIQIIFKIIHINLQLCYKSC